MCRKTRREKESAATTGVPSVSTRNGKSRTVILCVGINFRDGIKLYALTLMDTTPAVGVDHSFPRSPCSWSSTRLPPIASCSRVHPDPDRDSLRRRVFWSREGALQISCGSLLIYSWFTWPNSTHKALFSAAHLRFPRQVPHVIAAPKYTPFSFPQSPTWV